MPLLQRFHNSIQHNWMSLGKMAALLSIFSAKLINRSKRMLTTTIPVVNTANLSSFEYALFNYQLSSVFYPVLYPCTNILQSPCNMVLWTKLLWRNVSNTFSSKFKIKALDMANLWYTHASSLLLDCSNLYICVFPLKILSDNYTQQKAGFCHFPWLAFYSS